MKTGTSAIALVTGIVAGIFLANAVIATDYTYTGGGIPGQWDDGNNWGGAGFPSGSNDGAIIPDGFGPSFTSGIPAALNLLQTGNTAVSLNSGITFYQRSSPSYRQPTVTIGSGGLTGTSINFLHGSDIFTAAGNVTLGTLTLVNATPEQTGGVWDIAAINLGWSNGTSYVRAWNIVDGANTVFSHGTIAQNGDIIWTGTPVISGGRPDWNLNRGGDGQKRYHLESYTLYGDQLLLDGWPGGALRFAIMFGDGATIDVNSVTIGTSFGNNPTTYVDIDNSDIYIGGSGTAWNNQSNNATLFDLATATTVTFDPTSGALSVDTGSADLSSCALNPADWEDNFAFDLVQIGAGDTITLTGTANIGGGPTALYARTIVGLGGGGTLATNGHNVYLLEAPSNVTFDTSGGGAVYAPPVCPATLIDDFLSQLCTALAVMPTSSQQALAIAQPLAESLVATAGVCDACVEVLLGALE